MMNSAEREARIIQALRIKPVTHGQVHTFQIAIPEFAKQEISVARQELLRNSLRQQGTNLVPLVVRPTQKYSEDEEFEVVYGADWCLVAKELDIEKLWVWVFEMTDEEADAARVEMEELAASSSSEKDREPEKKIQPISNPAPDEPKPVNNSQIEVIESKIETLVSVIEKLSHSVAKPSVDLVQTDEKPTNTEVERRLEKIDSQIDSLLSSFIKLEARIERIIPPEKLNLRTAPKEEITTTLEKTGATSKQIKSCLEAIQYWKKPGKELSWENLLKSTKTGKDKINNFGKESYKKLEAVTEIR